MPLPKPGSIADIVLSADNYSALLTANSSSPRPPATNDSSEFPSISPHSHNRTQPPTSDHPPPSISDLVLDNLTYDRILSSSTAKGLNLSSDFRPPPISDSDDARTPPNSPTSAMPSQQQSLMAAAFGIAGVGKGMSDGKGVETEGRRGLERAER